MLGLKKTAPNSRPLIPTITSDRAWREPTPRVSSVPASEKVRYGGRSIARMQRK